jgi:hypothetical protein
MGMTRRCSQEDLGAAVHAVLASGTLWMVRTWRR